MQSPVEKKLDRVLVGRISMDPDNTVDYVYGITSTDISSIQDYDGKKDAETVIITTTGREYYSYLTVDQLINDYVISKKVSVWVGEKQFMNLESYRKSK